MDLEERGQASLLEEEARAQHPARHGRPWLA
eukprot:CAMPEP_0168455810 /NCGR_PEP_ID=MMETSP0228-20121227/50949_1 /TAXON_ID=133427 /ORGANISM="Protoceratium reticulatum, Strain CCCM 535 (=CCMP 1889)" /LENGTH=30 /DNA_ID= /DNA_START= /DNA_END= /DNA_ORIENTATION=